MQWPRNLRLTRGMRSVIRSASKVVQTRLLTPTVFAGQVARGGVTEVTEFGSNPGKLRMLVIAPSVPLAAGAPLVVLLHGCSQDPADFAAASGWAALAERLGFGLLLPEQVHDNNPGRCFNWFLPADSNRGRGEALSIRQMVAEAVLRLRTDPKQVFIVGMSAGGGMAAALLAAYPDVFRGGAIVAGLPAGSADGMAEAFARMRSAGPPVSPEVLAARVRGLAPARYAGPWPRVSVWAGERDTTVDPANSELLAAQWSALHGDAANPVVKPAANGNARHRIWGDANTPNVELWTIDTLGHGYPIDSGSRAGGHAAPWVIDVGISATDQIARFWGLSVF